MIKTMKRRILKLAFSMIYAFMIFSCGDEIANIAISGIITSSPNLMLNVGTSDTIKAIVSPMNATDKSVTWSSGNTAIVTVSSSGVVTAVAPGSAIIKVTTIDGNFSGSCSVTVTKWTNYKAVDRSNYVADIVVDANGNKWVGTWGGGLSKFDDTNWTTYTTSNSNISNDFVLEIAIDDTGTKWFGTFQGGVSKYDGTTWKSYPTNGWSVWAIAIGAGGNQLWGTGGEMLIFDGNNWNCDTAVVKRNIHSILIDAQGTKWFGTDTDGVLKSEGDKLTRYNTSNSGIAGNLIQAIVADAQGNKWFGTWGNGVSKFDGTNWINYKRVNGLASDTVVSIALDAQGNKWFGTWNGVSKFDGTNWTTYRRKNGLACDTVTSIAIDTQDNKWFGTWKGVSKLED